MDKDEAKILLEKLFYDTLNVKSNLFELIYYEYERLLYTEWWIPIEIKEDKPLLLSLKNNEKP